MRTMLFSLVVAAVATLSLASTAFAATSYVTGGYAEVGPGAVQYDGILDTSATYGSGDRCIAAVQDVNANVSYSVRCSIGRTVNSYSISGYLFAKACRGFYWAGIWTPTAECGSVISSHD